MTNAAVQRAMHLPAPAVGGVVCCLGVACLAARENAALLIVLASCCLPFALLFIARAIAWREPYASMTCIGLIVLQCAVFRIRDIDDKSIDAQIFCRLFCLAFMTVMACSAHLRKSSSFNSFPRLVLVAFVGAYAIVECLIAFNPFIAIVETGSNVIVLVFLIGIFERLGADRLLRIVIGACGCMAAMSLIAYVVYPSLGRMTDWGGEAYVITDRLQGVFGTPNGAGAAAAFALLATMLFYGNDGWRRWDMLQIIIFGIILFASDNRMAIGAAIYALSMFVLRRRGARWAITIAVCVASVTLLTLMQFGDSMATFLSRSGKVGEVMSANGRMQIWSVVLDLWSERPILGYGVGSAKFILPHDPRLFGAAAHAHDLYLNVLFAGGVVGLALLIASLATAWSRAWSKGAERIIALLVFFLLSGVTEPIIGGPPSLVSILFASTLLLSAADDRIFMSAPLRRDVRGGGPAMRVSFGGV